MKSYLPVLSLAIFLANCTSAYKSGQTPDDVYFSPGRPQDEYVTTENNHDNQYRSEEADRNDRYLRMKIRDRRWATLDDGYYAYDYYPAYGNYYPSNSYGFNSAWNAPYLWNYYYNPYCGGSGIIISNPKSTVYNRPRFYNLRVFDNPVNTTNPKNFKTTLNPSYSHPSSNNGNYRNSGKNAGDFLRNVFSGSGNSNSGSGSTNSKTYSSGTGSSSSGSSSSSSGSSSRGHATRGGN
ncbi:MAG: hypothetical protein ACXVBR_13670 [Flavisolibacter sp.]